jgi:hypothetical protein
MNKTGKLALAVVLLSVSIAAGGQDGLSLPELHGFVDYRAGAKFDSDPRSRDVQLNELRLQLELNEMYDFATLQLRSDFIYDDVAGSEPPDLQDGSGWIDLREAYVLLYPSIYTDVKIGRQILTWGTGDLLFINDVFAKDWQSFFIGRDETYLKAPSDAFLVSLFPGFANIDLAYMPRFDSSRYIRGERISYWNPMLGRIAGEAAVVDPIRRDKWFDEDEIAARVYRNITGYELALYGYDGYWKTPKGFNRSERRAFYPELSVYGASARGTAAAGIASVEAGYYDSRQDREGDDPNVPNSEIRVLAAYERELAPDFTAGGQWYIEHMMNYDEYTATAGAPLADEDRHVFTLRLTATAMRDDLVASVFTYYSPTDEDYYSRPVVTYKLRDNLQISAGANIFGGEHEHTFFGQFEENSNYYASLKSSF